MRGAIWGLAALGACLVLLPGPALAAISLPGGLITEDFDSMGATGTAPPTDWVVNSSAGSNPPNALGLPTNSGIPSGGIANNGYNGGLSVGMTGDGDRALGVYGGAVGDTKQVMATFQNDTASPVSSFDLTYDMEVWYWRFMATTPRSAGFNLRIDTGSGPQDVGGTFDAAVTNVNNFFGDAVWLPVPDSITGIGGTIDLAALNAGNGNIAAAINPGQQFTLVWDATVGEPEPLGGDSRHGVVSVDNLSIDFGEAGGPPPPPPPPPAGPQILFIGNSAGPTSGADGAVMTFLQDRYGSDNVTYQQASTVNAGDELAFDALIISSTISSGAARNKFQNSPVGILNWEEALVDDDDGEFQMSIVNKPTGQTEIEIVDNSHYITDGFDLGPLTIFTTGTETIAQNGLIAAGVDVLADEAGTADATLFVAETGAALFGDGSAARPDTAFGRRAVFPITDSGFNNLNADGLEIFGRTVDWVAGADLAQAVPEPSTLVLAGLGLLGLGIFARRRRRV